MDIKSIRRDEIGIENSDALVALFPSRESGIDFITENNAWGFVNIQKEPEYVGLYISGKAKQIRYFAEVDKIVPAEEASLAQNVEEYEDYESGRKVLIFKKDSLFMLEDSIPFESRVLYPPVRYTTLQTFKTAETMDDLF